MRFIIFFLFLCLSIQAQAQTEPQIPDIKQEVTPDIIQDEELPKKNMAPKEMILQPAELSGEKQKALDGVIDSLDIGKEKESWKIQLKHSDESAPNKKRQKPLFSGFRELLGKILRFAVGVTLAAAVCVAAVYAYRNKNRLFPRLDRKSRAEREPSAEEPWQLLEEAATLHRAGKIREAWALCFRAFTAYYALYFPLPADTTEYEALALARDNGTNTEGFALFIRRWINFAYGGIDPTTGTFEESLASCRALLADDSPYIDGAPCADDAPATAGVPYIQGGEA